MRKSVEAFAEDYVAGRMLPQSRTNLFWSCTLEAEKDYTYIGAPPFHEDANASSDNVLDTLWKKKRKPSSKKGVKEAAGVPSAKRALGTWCV